MPQKLEDLTIKEISIVDRPANAEHGIPRARIALWKRDDSTDNRACKNCGITSPVADVVKSLRCPFCWDAEVAKQLP